MFEQPINKTMDFEDLNSKLAEGIVSELNSLIGQLAAKSLKISSWYGTFDLPGDPQSHNVVNRGYNYQSLPGAVDDRNFPWFLYWEIVWLVINSDFKPPERILDLGGSSSLFSFYMASRGNDVTTVDLNSHLVENANHVSEKMNWKMRNHVMDMRDLMFDSQFDHVTSVCVYEHIPLYDRVAINRGIRNLLIDGGKFSISFDYRNPSRAARISSPKGVHEQFVEPSGLKVRGNQEFFDNGKNYLLHPFYSKRRLWKDKAIEIGLGHFSPLELFKTKDHNHYTFGALFLEK
jgi:hypothetical protein